MFDVIILEDHFVVFFCGRLVKRKVSREAPIQLRLFWGEQVSV